MQEKKGTDILVKADKLEMTQDTIISYLMTYVLPFVTDSSLNVQNIILFLIILVLAVRLDIVYINPTLILLKYNVFKNADKDKYYLTKNTLSDLEAIRKSGEGVKIIPLSKNIYYIENIY